MKLCVFMSDYRTGADIIERLEAEKLGIVLVGNGVYHAAVKEGAESKVFSKKADFYVLTEDLESRGMNASQVNSKAKLVTYDDTVDLIFNEFEKTIWI